METKNIKTKFTDHFDLRTKFVIIISGVILLTGLVVILVVQNIISKALRVELEERGISLVRNLTINSTDMILTEKILDINYLLNNTKEAEKDVVYIFIIDSKKQVLAHTFEEGFPLELLEVNKLGQNQTENIKLLDTDKGLILDFAYPILKGKLGTMRLGITEEPLRETVFNTIFRITTFISLILFSGIIIAIGFATLIISPIRKLHAGVIRIGKGDLSHRVDIKTGDEIEQLADEFNSMTDQLESLYKGLEEKIKERTKELQQKMKELEKFQKITVDRELKMIELKKEIKKLKEKL